MVAVYLVALFVHRKAAVGVAVERETHVETVFDNELSELFKVGGAAVYVDVQSVGSVADNVGIRAERVKHALRHLPCAAVRAVKTDLFALVGARRQRDEVADVAVSAGGVVDGAAYFVTLSVGQRLIGVEICLNTVKQALLHFFAVAVYELYAVVVVGVVACGDHDAAVEVIRPCDVGHARRAGDVQEIGVRAGGGKTRAERRLKHIAGAAGVLADNYLCLMLPAVVPAEVTADFESMVNRQIDIGLSAKAVGSEIFAHWNSS